MTAEGMAGGVWEEEKARQSASTSAFGDSARRAKVGVNQPMANTLLTMAWLSLPPAFAKAAQAETDAYARSDLSHAISLQTLKYGLWRPLAVLYLAVQKFRLDSNLKTPREGRETDGSW